MRLCQLRTKLQGTTAGRLGLCECFVAGRVLEESKAGTVGEARERQRIIGIERDRAPVEIFGCLECLRPALVEKLRALTGRARQVR